MSCLENVACMNLPLTCIYHPLFGESARALPRREGFFLEGSKTGHEKKAGIELIIKRANQLAINI